MSNQVICSHPRTIINPKAVELIHRYRHYFVDGVEHYWKGSFSRLQSFLFSYSIKKVRVPTSYGYKLVDPEVPLSLLQNSFILNDEDNEIFPFYIQVPCGHCANCIMSRQSSFVQRCLLETQSHRTWPWFVTLTYKRRYLPKDRQLCVRDVQNFLKRFRIRLERDFNGRYNGVLRYAVCGEYGKKKRAHYHLILWGIQSFGPKDYADVLMILRSSWSVRLPKSRQDLLRSPGYRIPRWYRAELEQFDYKRELIGFITSRVIDPSDDDNCFKYTTKYMCKPIDRQNLPFPTAKRPYIVSSKGSKGVGSIGKPYLYSIANFFDKTGRTKPLYINKFNRNVKNLYTNRWVIDTLFPSKCMVIPSGVRKAFKELSFYRCRDLLKKRSSVLKFLDVWRLYYYDPFIHDDLFYVPELTLDDCFTELRKWMKKKRIKLPSELDQEFRNAEVCQINRDRFLLGLFSDAPEIDLKARAYKANQDLQRQIALEVL